MTRGGGTEIRGRVLSRSSADRVRKSTGLKISGLQHEADLFGFHLSLQVEGRMVPC